MLTFVRKPAAGLVDGLIKRLRRTRYFRQRKVLPAALKLVTPVTPLILSDYFLSTEVENQGLRFLNRKSKPLRRTNLSKLPSGAVIYVSRHHLADFVEEYAPKIASPFIVISGQIMSPPPPERGIAKRLLAHPDLLAWFSQNHEDSTLDIRPFPYGVGLWSSPNVLAAQERYANDQKNSSIYVPHSAIHSHLVDPALRIRSGLKPLMAKPERHQDYLKTLSEHRFVISPPCDRPDTFRHWECVAMGAIPVSELPETFRDLFGDCAILVDDLVESVNGPFESQQAVADRALASVDYWRQVVDATRHRT
jgi:hypothetical protein